MKAFMDKEFMLQSPTAQHLYHDYAADMPICDYHCHIPPREIYGQITDKDRALRTSLRYGWAAATRTAATLATTTSGA